MALRWFLLLSLICSILLLVDVTHSAAQDTRKAYVVYMGDKPKNEVPILPDLHVNMLQGVVDSSNIDIAHEALLLHSYKRSFNGFAAMLTEQEAQKITEKPESYTMAIHHGGYFNQMPNGTKKYKIATFNKLGGKSFLDNMDPDNISWVEMNNIAWDLGYREKPISYYYKLPGSSSGEGWMKLLGDGDCVEMINQLPKRKRIIEVYITGGGPRKKREAELDDEHPPDPSWHNPLNNVGTIDNENMIDEASLLCSQLNAESDNVVEDSNVAENEGPEVVEVCGTADTLLSVRDFASIGEVVNLFGDTHSSIRDEGQSSHCIDLEKISEGKESNVKMVTKAANKTCGVVAAENEMIKDSGAQKQVAAQKANNGVKGKQTKVVEEKVEEKKGGKDKGNKYNTRFKGKKKAKSQDQDGYSTDDSDLYVDSDYDQNGHDDEIDFDENVAEGNRVEEYEDMGYEGIISDDDESEDELKSLDGSETEEDEHGNPLPKSQQRKLKAKSWRREVDLKNPNFCIGQAFADNEVLKEAVREYAIRKQRGLWFDKNNKYKIQVKCQVGCPFWLYASRIDPEDPTMYIKTLRLVHKCHVVQELPFLNVNRIAEEVAQDLMVNPEWQRKGVLNHIQKKFGLDVSLQTVYRATLAAKRKNDGHYVDQYNKLAAYKQELKRSNPGSTVEIKTEMDGAVRRFQRIYICLAACKKGWLKGCRPIIGLDGCHMKGQHPGQLLAAVGIDANNGMFPIAYAICEVENTDTWRWFLEYLISDLKMENSNSYTFITDKQKGLRNAIAELMPNSEHRHCVRHLYNNFKIKHPGEGLKQTVWNAARSSTTVWFNKHMEALKMQSVDAWKWFEDKAAAHWTRSHFKTTSKCDVLLNNLCESFNAALLKGRDKPILTGLEWIRMDLMIRMANRRIAGMRWRDAIGPRVSKILDKVGQRTHLYKAHRAGEFNYQVVGGDLGGKHSVDLGAHICTCRRWQLSGLPCVHAICAIYAKKQDPALYVDDYFLQTKYMDAYNPIIMPIAGEDDWTPVDYPIAPPPHKKQPGRPKMKRIKEAGEKLAPPAPNASAQATLKMSRSQYVNISCKICHQKGHNKNGCPTTKASTSKSQGGSTSQVKAGRKRKMDGEPKRAAAAKKPKTLKQLQVTSKEKLKKLQNEGKVPKPASTRRRSKPTTAQSVQGPIQACGSQPTQASKTSEFAAF